MQFSLSSALICLAAAPLLVTAVNSRWEVEFYSDQGGTVSIGQAGSKRPQGCTRVGGVGAETLDWTAGGAFRLVAYPDTACSHAHSWPHTADSHAAMSGFKVQSYEVFRS